MSKIIQAINNQIKTVPILLWIIITIGIFLRIVGINYGFPLFLNIDEPALVSTVLSLKSSLNPGHFDWPHLYFYVNAPVYAVFGLLRDLLQKIGYDSEIFGPHYFFLVSRLLTAAFGTLTVFLIYKFTANNFNQKTALIASFFMAILPVHVYESHFAKTDTAQTFFTALCLIWIFKVFRTNKRRDYIISGILIGLNTSIKYGGALMFFPLLLAFALNKNNNKKWISKMNLSNIFISGLFSVLSFYLTTPFALLDYDKFFSKKSSVGAVWQIQNVGSREWSEYPASVYETFFKMYPKDMGYGIWIIFILLIFLFLFFNKRSKNYILLILPTFVISMYISHFDRSPSHYFLFLSPFYIPAVSYFIYEIYQWVKKKLFIIKTGPVNGLFKRDLILLIIVLAISIPSLLAVIKQDILFVQKDTRTIAYDWIRSNLKDEDRLIVVGELLQSFTFKEKNSDGVKRLDSTTLKEYSPFYVMIGIDDISKESITTGDRDPENMPGNQEKVLKGAELLFEVQDKNRLGPPIYIFKVTEYNYK